MERLLLMTMSPADFQDRIVFLGGPASRAVTIAARWLDRIMTEPLPLAAYRLDLLRSLVAWMLGV
ncbi:hypothetical protein AB0C02_26305 [Micromonospora sp. NPDC048999]|uniref:hypothetical protein n=1 Tax=Micromonospora sp. NPDC048999 TaxID=3155391 RepID=UPI0033E5D0DC